MRDAKEYMDVAVIHSSFEKNPLIVAFVKPSVEVIGTAPGIFATE